MENIKENIKLVLSMSIVGLILLYIGTLLFMPEMTIKIFRFQPYIVLTESMEPVLDVNDMVIITPFDIEEAKVGDMITFEADIDYNGSKEIVTHYIYSIVTTDEDTFIRTNRHFEESSDIIPDTWLIQEADIIGSYGLKVKYVGFLTGFIKSVYGIAIITLNVIIVFAVKYLNKKTKEESELEEPVHLHRQVSIPGNLKSEGQNID
jgi:signal peptidase